MSLQVLIETEDLSGLRQFSVTEGFTDTFVDSLTNPEEPKHCARYYIYCMDLFIFEPQMYTELRCVRPDVFSAILRFLTIRRPDSLITVLEKQLSTCRCAETDMHSLDNPPPAQIFPCLVNRAVSFITIAFKPSGRGGAGFQWPSLDNTRKGAKRADKRGERFPWPKQPSDVFVNPPEMTVQTLWKLYHTYEDPVVVMSLHLLILAAGTTFTSVIYTIPDFAPQFTYHFERVLVEKDEIPSPTFTMLLHILLYATNRFFESDKHLINAWWPHVSETILAVSKALYIFDALPGPKTSDDPKSPTKLQLLSRCGHVLLLFSYGNPRVQASHHLFHPMIISETSLLAATFPTEDNHVIAYDKIYRLTTSDRCHAPGCTETFSKQSRRFQACSQCMVVSYCSKSCQALAWKHPDVPHKPFCAALVSYTKKICVNWRKTAIRPQLDSEGVARMCLAGGVSNEESTCLLNFDLELLNWNALFKSMGAVDGAEFRRLMATARHK